MSVVQTPCHLALGRWWSEWKGSCVLMRNSENLIVFMGYKPRISVFGPSCHRELSTHVMPFVPLGYAHPSRCFNKTALVLWEQQDAWQVYLINRPLCATFLLNHEAMIEATTVRSTELSSPSCQTCFHFSEPIHSTNIKLVTWREGEERKREKIHKYNVLHLNGLRSLPDLEVVQNLLQKLTFLCVSYFIFFSSFTEV